MWIWWAAMYLGHHYMIDLVAGGIYAVVAFWIGSSFLPPVLSYGGTHAISKENHLFFDAPEYTIVGRSEDREQWAEDSDNEATESSSDTLVVDMNNEMDMISSMESITATDRMLDTKIWTRWQGYEGWAVALRSARLGQSVLQNSLDASYEFTSKQIFNTSPQESRKDLDRCDVIHPQDVVDLETVGQATNDAVSGGSGPSLLRGGPVAPPTSRQIVLDRGMAPNLAISAATNGTADDGTKRMSRSVHLSISESSSGAASGWSSPTSPSRTVFSEAEIAASLEVSVDSSVDASPDVLTTASVTLGLIAPTTPVAATMAKVIPSANASKRLKDD
ncbi:hypothetical protein BGZ99_008581 [Dissophora globulifera]|uniref:Uncharacterized protein n=1 Tax=Dissophora globulifera TaxID=979702 RepID=A0A9P6R6M8_9FUNG|nr:hypothetical protein BGZ99_008581 [Dissophora globulifera]